MTTWNSGPGFYPPPNDPNQAYYGAQPGYPPQQPYPGAMPPQGYPGAMPPQGFPGAMPPQGFPAGGYPSQGAGFMQPPPYGHNPGSDIPPMGQPQQPGMYGASSYQDPEDDVKGFDFSDRSIRHGFIRKVYSILVVQLAITLGFIALFMYHMPTKRFVQHHRELWWVALVVLIVCIIAMSCCGNVRRKAPMNFIFLGLFTVAQAFMLGVTTSNFDTEAVLLAVGITTAVCLGLTLFAFQTKWDFTVMGGALFVLVIILFVFGLIAMIVKVKIVTLIYASLGALLFSFYLIYDTQMMLGGKHKYTISPEEYIFAALNLYLDIINIFLYILTIIGASRD